ncbi:glycosyltransferase family 2 protein [Luteimonas suaedae]|uniref:glycosyltransferase family 2 protein n=1 Tax=Luteimonas suaedae TaxID=2605430 RepID=UPI0011EFE35D|nr:glycosyltransferase [Luteimonas suaedae]
MCLSQQPLVSVIIPLYNRAETIVDAVSSVFGQDYTNVEVIVVDDGSTDGSVERLKEIQDARLKLLRQANAGACVARNRGIDEAQGKYIALLDSDDLFLPWHLTDAVTALEAGPDNGVVYGQVIADRGEGRELLKPPRGIDEGEDVSEYLLADTGFIQTSTLVLPRSLATAVRYSPGLRFGQDTDFAIRLSTSGARISMLARPQARWMDQADPRRVSSSFDPTIRTDWHDSVAGLLTARAKRADAGWHVAKCHFKQGHWRRAISLYARALLSGCYSPKLAARVFLQVFVPTAGYRRLADWLISKRRQTTIDLDKAP